MNSAEYHKDPKKPIIITVDIQDDLKMKHRKIASVKFLTIDTVKDQSLTEKVLEQINTNMDKLINK